MKRRFLSLFLVLVVFFAFFPCALSEALANDFSLQITDPRDTKIDIDIKNVYARTDENYVYFRLESWGNWNLEEQGCSVFLWFNTKGTHDDRDINYAFILLESSGRGLVGVFDGRNILDVYEADFFRKDNPTMIIRISKRDTRMQNDVFSFSLYLVSLSQDYPLDIVPDSDILFRYKPGPTTNAPRLGAEPKDIEFGTVEHDETPVRVFNLYNEGKSDLRVNMKSSSGAFTIFPDNLTIGGYSIAEVSVHVNRSAARTGMITDTIQIESNGGSATIALKADILDQPVLVCTTTAINLGLQYIGDRPTDTFVIQNKNRGRIKGTVRSTQRWITLSMTSFSAERQSVNVTVNTRGLDPGEYEGKIIIQSDGGSHTLDVALEVQAAIQLEINELDFGKYDLDELGNFPEKEILVSNVSPRNQQVSISADNEWLKITPAELNLSRNSSAWVKVTVQPEYIEKTSRDYVSRITIQTRNESHAVSARMSIQATPPSLNWIREDEKIKQIRIDVMIGTRHDELIEISNNGGGELSGSGSLKHKNTPHRLFNATFKLKKDETHTFRVSFDATNQKIGEYNEILEIKTNGGNLEIPIIVTVTPLPEIVIKLFIGIAYAYIDDKEVQLEAAPYISKGSSMVPLRFIGEAFNAAVEWQNIGKGRITITLKQRRLQLDIGEILAFIDRVPYVLPVAPEIKNSRTFVPIRFISEGLGASIDWDPTLNMITIRFSVEPD